MKLLELTLALVILALSTNYAHSKFNMEKIFQNIVKPKAKESIKSKNAVKFSFSNCGPSSDPFTVASLMVHPDPVKLPGNITLNGEANIKSDLTGPMQVKSRNEKPVLGNLLIEGYFY